MKLLEYQAKEVLASLGIAIPPGRVARTPEEAAAACAELGPIAVKAQVPVGGRGKAGGIKLANSPDEARAAAQQIIGMDIKGFKVPLVYCETALDIEREIYLSYPAHATCGGRTPAENVVDKTLMLLVTGDRDGGPVVTQGAFGPTKPPTTTFPYLAAPN